MYLFFFSIFLKHIVIIQWINAPIPIISLLYPYWIPIISILYLYYYYYLAIIRDITWQCIAPVICKRLWVYPDLCNFSRTKRWRNSLVCALVVSRTRRVISRWTGPWRWGERATCDVYVAIFAWPRGWSSTFIRVYIALMMFGFHSFFWQPQLMNGKLHKP